MLVIRSLGENRLPANQILAEGGLGAIPALLKTQYTALQRVAMDINTRKPTSQYDMVYRSQYGDEQLYYFTPHAEQNNSSERAGMVPPLAELKRPSH